MKFVKKSPLLTLAVPIFIEQALHLLTSTMDVLMVSTISDDAVAALGISNQFVVLSIMVFGFVGIGSSVVVTHSLGGGDKRGAEGTAVTALSLNVWLGFLISLIVSLNATALLRLMQLPEHLMVFAQPYLVILGATLWLESHNVAAGAVLRAHGHTTDAMWITMLQNVVNVVGNAVLLFGLFGAPKLGVTGVALATAGSRVVAAIGFAIQLRRRTGIRFGPKQVVVVSMVYLRRILKIGLPSAGEHLSWWIAFMTITSFTARMGATELAIQSYAMQVMHFVFTFSYAIALANEIMLGKHVGAGEFDAAYHRMLRSLRTGLIIVSVAMLPNAVFGASIIGFFSSNLAIISVGALLLKLALIIEPGRLLNMSLVCGLRATGDVGYPFKIGLITMWGIWVPLSWLFGITFGWGLPGLWAAMIVDEVVRGWILFQRWKKREWLPNAKKSRAGVTTNLAGP